MALIRRTTSQIIAEYEELIKRMKSELRQKIKNNLISKDSKGMPQLIDLIVEMAKTYNTTTATIIRSVIRIKQIILEKPIKTAKQIKNKKVVYTDAWKKNHPEKVKQYEAKNALGKHATQDEVDTLVLIQASKRQLRKA